MTKISVIVPAYNEEKHIGDCLESLIRQTLPDLEILCVDDGSTDHTREILEEYARKDDRICVISRENGGLSAARNTGMEAAKGEYLYFCDADDILMENALTLLYEKAKSLDLDVLSFSGENFPEGESKDPLRYARKYESKAVMKGLDLLDVMNAEKSFIPNVMLQFYKRSFLEENNLRFYEGILHEDQLFTVEVLCKAARTYMITDVLYRKRIHPDSIMTSKRDHRNCEGYFISFREIHRLASNLSARDFEVVKVELDHLLDECKWIYLKLDGEERKKVFADYPVQDQYYFNKLVAATFLGEVAMKEEKALMTSKSYKWGRVVTYFPRKIRKLCGQDPEGGKGKPSLGKRIKGRLHRTRLSLAKVFLKPFPHYECPCCGNFFLKPAAPKRNYCTDTEHVDVRRYSPDRLKVYCPVCMAMPRHRILVDYLSRKPEILKGKRILYFSVEKGVAGWLKKNQIPYVSADLFKKADLRLDMTDIALPDACEDVIIANHVLEHVPSFKAALSELYRVLSPDGTLICSFPMDMTFETVTPEAEDYETLSKEEIIHRYGQEDHRRIFGRDSKDLLEKAGFSVEVIDGSQADKKILPVVGPADYDQNILFLCRKTGK